MLVFDKNPEPFDHKVCKDIDINIIPDFFLILKIKHARGRHVSIGIIRCIVEQVNPGLKNCSVFEQ